MANAIAEHRAAAENAVEQIRDFVVNHPLVGSARGNIGTAPTISNSEAHGTASSEPA
jgi:hypothetical protein